MALVKYNNNSISDITTAGQVAIGSLVPIKTLTASGSATLSFVHGTDGVVLDSTYPIYKFEFINMHSDYFDPADTFQFNLSTDSGSNYNVTKTTTFFRAFHDEADTATGLGYRTADDLAQSTSFQKLGVGVGTDSDIGCTGTLQLFNPSSTTYVKHFIAECNEPYFSTYSIINYVSGYANTTSAINGIRFQYNGGNIDSGKIKLYGIKDS